jgi:hypothetical protein
MVAIIIVFISWSSTSITIQPALAQANASNSTNQTGAGATTSSSNQSTDWISNILITIFVPIIVGLIAAIGGIYGGIRKERSDRRMQIAAHKQKLEQEYDITLRTKRIEAYKALWSCLYLLRFFSRPKMIDRTGIEYLTTRLTYWYYNEGGIFLTEASQKAYTSLMEMLKEYCEKHSDDKSIADDYMKQEKSEYHKIRKAASVFRTILCKDVGTRDEPRLPSLYDDLRIRAMRWQTGQSELVQLRKKEKYQKKEEVILRIEYNRRDTRDLSSDLEFRLRNPYQGLAEFADLAEIKVSLEVRNLDNDEDLIPIMEKKVEQDSESINFTLGPLSEGTYLARANWGLASSATTFKVEKN